MRRVLNVVIVFIGLAAAFSDSAWAETPVVFEVGLRVGGLLDTLPVPPSGSQHFAPIDTVEKFPLSVGPTAGAVLFDRVVVRFEAVRKSIRFRSESTVPPAAGFSYVGTTRAHSWDYPILAAYRFGNGPIRPFAGGGFSLGGKIIYTEETRTTLIPSGTITTHTSEFESRGATSFCFSGGVYFRTAFLAVRPELRFSMWPDASDSAARALHAGNSVEFLVGVLVHPFKNK
jgi:hypothetical protein